MGLAGAGSKDSLRPLVQKLKGRMQAENLKAVFSEENKIQEVRHLPSCHSDRQTDRGTPDATSTTERRCLHWSCPLVLKASLSCPPRPELTAGPRTPGTSTGWGGPLATA